MSDLVSVIIVNWNGRHHLETCLPALMQQTYGSVEIILVDNNSSDDSTQFVQAHFPQVRVLPLRENVGFARGNNVGILASTAPFVATLNNDTKPRPNWLTELVTAARASPDIGMVASKMLFFDRPQMINSAGIAIDRAGIAWDRWGGQADSGSSDGASSDDAAADIFGACAGAALYRRAMLDQVGLFDEDYFMYLEDVDLAWRGQLAGWRCVYAPTAVVYHHHSASAVEGSPFKSRLLGRNKLWTIMKNYPWPLVALYWPLIALYDAGSVGVALLQRRDVNPLIGRLWALPGLGKMWRKRRAVQRLRAISARRLRALMAPVAAPATVQRRYRHLQ